MSEEVSVFMGLFEADQPAKGQEGRAWPSSR